MKASQIHEDFQNEMSKIGPKVYDSLPVAKNNGATPLNVEGGKLRSINNNKKYSTKKV